MWIDGKFMTEPEIQAYLAQTRAERDAYKEELIQTLRDYLTCIGGDIECTNCKYFVDENGLISSNECPSKLSKFKSHLRLEELLDESRMNIC